MSRMSYVNPNLRAIHSKLNPTAKVFEFKPKANGPRNVANVKPNMRKMTSSPNSYAKVFAYKFMDESSISACQGNTKQSLLVYYQPAPHIYPIINGHIVKLVDTRTGAPFVGPDDYASTPLLVYPQSGPFQLDESHQLHHYAFETFPYRPSNQSFCPVQQQSLQQQQPKSNRRSRNYRGNNNNNQQQLVNAFQTTSQGPSVYRSLLGLLAELKGQISYMQIIDEIAHRLCRSQIEIKRMVPAALHRAIQMGFLRKVDEDFVYLNEEPQA